MSPQKRGAGAFTTPAHPNYAKPLTATNSAIAWSAQGTCDHRVVLVEYLPPTHTHHAKETCDQCRRFVRWGAKPENLERRLGDSFRIAKLSMCEGLTKWEAEFLKSIAQQRRLSPKQQEILNKLAAEHLEGAP